MTGVIVARIVLSILLALLLALTGGGKLAGTASSHAIRDSLHIGAGRWRAIGVFEIVTVVLLIVGIWIAPVSVVGMAAVVVLMIGAIVARVNAGGEQRKAGVRADAVVLVLGLLGLVLSVLGVTM